MREFQITFDAAKLQGLRKHHTNPRNSGGLLSCYNALPTEKGLLALEPATKLFSDQYLFDIIPPISWPFPQMLLGKRRSILAFQTMIFTINTIDWSLTKVLDYGTQNWDEDNDWHIADSYDMLIGANGSKVFWYNNTTSVWEDKLADSTMPIFGTVCDFNGQIIAGNITSTWHGCDEQFVIWGEIGSFDMTPTSTNVAGFRPMPFKGEVKHVKSLKSAVIVYGEGGIAALIPKDTTFGLIKLADYGVSIRTAVGGDENQHVFIDENGWLRRITNELKIERLGYQEFFESMLTGYPTINYDELEKRFYISEGTNNYVLTPQGLGQSFQSITSGIYSQGAFVGNIISEDRSEIFELEIDTFDMGVRAQKTIQTVEVGGDSSSTFSVAVKYRFKTSDSFATTSYVTCNNEGIAALPCAGIEFRLLIRVTDYSDVNLDYVIVRYKMTDKRSIRGVYATQTSS